jgi:hypothetical protein
MGGAETAGGGPKSITAGCIAFVIIVVGFILDWSIFIILLYNKMSSIPLYGGLHTQFMLLGLTGPNSGPVISPLVTSRSENTPLFAPVLDDFTGSTGITGPQGPTGVDLFQPGMIMMFNSATPPAGWLLADGTSGTPDLRARFIMQQYPAATFDFGETGGTGSIVLDITRMPAHTHTFDTHNGVGTSLGAGSAGSPSGASEATSSVGSATPFDILPFYYVLTFIMKS